MKDLKEIVKEQRAEDAQSDFKYKLAAVVCIIILLYIAYRCAFSNFKILTFLNPVMEQVLRFFNRIFLFVSQCIREILYVMSSF